MSQPRNRLQVIVCDDHRTLREALAAYLFAQPDIAAVHAVGDADEAIRLARGGGDVLLLDLSLGGDVTGLDVLEALHNLHIRVPVLVMTATDDLDLLAKALALGALGFCHKSVHPDVLYRAVLSVAQGRAALPNSLVVPLVRRLRADQRSAEEAGATLSMLTAREVEVLRLLGKGVNRTDIARRLNVSSNTVRTHLRHVMQKLGVNTQLAAAARARVLFEAPDRTIALPDVQPVPVDVPLATDSERGLTAT